MTETAETGAVAQRAGAVEERAGAELPSVVVVGGGLVGLCSAYYLAKAGASVKVLERGKVGGGASRFNAGEITTRVSPLPGPGIVRKVAGTVFRSDGAIRIAPPQALRGIRFFSRFLRNCTHTTYDARLAALVDLSRPTFGLFDDLAAAGIATDMRTNGYLVCAASRQAAEEARQHYLDARYGASPPGPLLDRDALREFEPALSEAAVWGFVRHDERWMNANWFVERMAEALREMGVEIVEDAAATTIETLPTEVRVHSGAGAFRADSVVIAAGFWSDRICRTLGVPLGMQPGKGYSFTIGVKTMPQRLIAFADEYVVATPTGERLRIGGTMEFDGTTAVFNPRRIEPMIRVIRDFFPGVDWNDIADRWVAPRPMTPDGLPYIGRLEKAPRVVVATGHNMLGLTLGPATGTVVADLVLGREPAVDLTLFDPHRYA